MVIVFGVMNKKTGTFFYSGSGLAIYDKIGTAKAFRTRKRNGVKYYNHEKPYEENDVIIVELKGDVENEVQ